MKNELRKAYQAVRSKTAAICHSLEEEDYVIQSMLDVSPPKWHLAHTTWFFESFLLKPHASHYRTFDPVFHYLFNSYYHSLGKFLPREHRGLLSRPTIKTVYAYRQHVDDHLLQLLDHATESVLQTLQPLMLLGINHEQQHQELLLMDIKHNLSINPTFPTYQTNSPSVITKKTPSVLPMEFSYIEKSIAEIGNAGLSFCFDNESPPHQKILNPYVIANRLVTNGEYLEFIMDAKGYDNPRWWLSDGWDYVKKNHWQAPLYWHDIDNKWHLFTLSGLTELNLAEPVAHVSYYEADAYARWRNCRLPLEEEWEHFVSLHNIAPSSGHFMETGIYHPTLAAAMDAKLPQQFFGDAWEWTASPYLAYPGFNALDGALGEYNGKFMINQFVLRGGSCITPESHIRTTYRNFFQPDKRWQYSGIRLAANP